MRALLSAYACEPNRGSEPEVGWQRALHMMAYADEVWVLTRANNQEVIEANPLSHSPGLHFIYYDLPGWALKLKRQAWFLPIYYILWQWGAYCKAAKYHRDRPFDSVYHVTLTSMQYGSFMGRLGIPFIIGPVAGGERAPLRLRRSLPLRGRVIELLRDIGILFQRYSPLTRSAFAAAKRIYVTTAESMKLIPLRCHFKTEVHLAIATDGNASQSNKSEPLRCQKYIYAGNLLYLKGVHWAIRALAEAHKTMPDATLTIVGSGPAEEWLRNVADQCRISHIVNFAGRVSRKQLVDDFPNYTALVFPSLHDSGGMVVLEALSAGLPVICLDLGGPAAIVNSSCGVVIPTADADETAIVNRIASAMISLGTMNSANLKLFSTSAIYRASDLSWPKLTESIVKFT